MGRLCFIFAFIVQCVVNCALRNIYSGGGGGVAVGELCFKY
jgi:hypothetical protein